MAFVFGDTLVCDDPASAQLVTFSAGVRCVTLDGDVYDPSGTLSGGAAPSGNGVLLRVQDLLQADQLVSVARQKIQEVEKREERAREGRERWMALVRDLEMKDHEMRLLEKQIGGSNANRVSTSHRVCFIPQTDSEKTADDIERLKKTIADLRCSIQSAKEKQKKAGDECKKLEKDMDEFKNNKEGKIEELKVCLLHMLFD
jgi:structural maintenance of chromosome 2